MKTVTAVPPLSLGWFLDIWGKYFVRFMIGWGGEMLRAALYMILGISFLAVGLGLPPELTAQAGSRHGGMTLFILIISVSFVVNTITFAWSLIREGLNNRKKPPTTAAPKQEAA